MINYIRVLGSFQLFTMSYGFYIAFFVELIIILNKFFFENKFIIKKGSKSFLILILIFSLIIFSQSILLQDYNSHIFAIVNDIRYRYSEYSVLGFYPISGNINYKLYFLLLVYLTYVFFIFNNIKNEDEFNNLIILNLKLYTVCFLFVFCASFSPNLVLKMKLLSDNAPNFLTQDDFGYRISGGFFEPSFFAAYFAPILAIAYVKFKNKKCILLLFLFFLLLSRSGGLLLIFFTFIFLLKKKVKFIPFIFMVLFIVLFVYMPENIIRNTSEDFILFRSIYERLLVPSINILSIPFVIGIDYGYVWTFFPILSIVIQVGILGIITFIIQYKNDLSIVICAFLICSLTRTLSAYEFWIPFCYIMIFKSKGFGGRNEKDIM